MSGKRVTNPIRIALHLDLFWVSCIMPWVVGNLSNMSLPGDLRYTSSHEWVRVEDGIATIGITDHAQSELGDVVYVDLPNVGRAVSKDDTFGSVESVKTVSDLYSPIGGEVVEVNAKLGSQSELVNSDPYGDGWMVKVKLSDAAEVDSLLNADAYSALI